MGPLDRAEDERLVLALRAGDQDAFGRLFDRWYDRVHELARRITRDDGLAADVAQDAFLAAWQRLDRLEDPASFGGWLLRIARNRALDVVRAPAHSRTEADEDVSLVADEQAVASRAAAMTDPALVAGDREVQDLVWSAAATLGERDLTALDLSLRHGLEPAEIGEVLGINRNAANQLVHRMKGRLATAVGCRVLWRGGSPACADLAGALEADGLDDFDTAAVKVADRHAATCADCSRRRETRLDPAKLFAAVPVAIAPALLKAKAAAALDAAGVPMGGVGGGSAGLTDGSGRTDDGTGGDYIDPVPRRHRRRPSRRAAAFGAAAVAVVAMVVAVLTVEQLDDGGQLATVEAPATTDPAPTEPVQPTTTTEPGMTIVLTTAPPGEPRQGDPDPDVAVPDPAPGPAPDPKPHPNPNPYPYPNPNPPPPPEAPPASISASPSRVPPTPGAPPVTVSWTSRGGTATVSGPGLSSSSSSGSQVVCPNPGWCFGGSGSYTYTITVTGPGGTTQDSVTVTVG